MGRLEAWREIGCGLGRGLLRLAVPPICPACGCGAAEPGCCGRCRAALTHGSNARLCGRCGASAGPHVDCSSGCFACRNDRFAFETVVRLGRYEGALMEACRRIKEERQRPLAAALGELLWTTRAAALRQLAPDAVVAVPLHWRRRWRRGYNQADEIADRLARGLGVPRLSALKRLRNTPPQAPLAASVRRTNVASSFRATRRLAGARILLVDDILTTGATCHHAARALRAAGAAQTVVAVLARGEDLGKALTPEDSAD